MSRSYELFLKWLEEKHPEVELTELQLIALRRFYDILPVGAGKTFLINLLAEAEKDKYDWRN